MYLAPFYIVILMVLFIWDVLCFLSFKFVRNFKLFGLLIKSYANLCTNFNYYGFYSLFWRQFCLILKWERLAIRGSRACAETRHKDLAISAIFLRHIEAHRLPEKFFEMETEMEEGVPNSVGVCKTIFSLFLFIIFRWTIIWKACITQQYFETKEVEKRQSQNGRWNFLSPRRWRQIVGKFGVCFRGTSDLTRWFMSLEC